jgi:hypothetical protein
MGGLRIRLHSNGAKSAIHLITDEDEEDQMISLKIMDQEGRRRDNFTGVDEQTRRGVNSPKGPCDRNNANC